MQRHGIAIGRLDGKSGGKKDIGLKRGVFGQFEARLRERRQRAEEVGDAAAIARYDAMQAVLRTRLVPLVCPEALTLAGEAAQAARQGLKEGEWLRLKCKECDRLGESRVLLYKAIRLLRTVGVWPWEPAAMPTRTPKEGGERGPLDATTSLKV
jgi:hypothetical protein